MLCCAICLAELQVDPHRLACDHVFHVSCVVDWFRRGHAECPVCRDVPAACVRESGGVSDFGIVTEHSLHGIADNLQRRHRDLDTNTADLLRHYQRVRVRLKRLRALACYSQYVRPNVQRLCRYAAQALEHEEELAQVGAQLLLFELESSEAPATSRARSRSDDEASDSASSAAS